MTANRIAYHFDFKGPALFVDSACSSSSYALNLAVNAIQNGECESAIVAGTNLILHPLATLQFMKLGVLSLDGYCRPLDANSSGYVRSDAIATVFLQKAKDAKRVYAQIVYSKTNCDGFKEQGITYPSGRDS